MAGCASVSFEKYAFIALDNSKTLYITGGQVIAKLYKEGKVSDGDKTKFIESGKQFKLAWDASQAALEIYVKTKNAADEQKLQVAFAAMQAALKVFNDFYLTLIKE
jgi:hypothetical protein